MQKYFGMRDQKKKKKLRIKKKMREREKSTGCLHPSPILHSFPLKCIYSYFSGGNAIDVVVMEGINAKLVQYIRTARPDRFIVFTRKSVELGTCFLKIDSGTRPKKRP